MSCAARTPSISVIMSALNAEQTVLAAIRSIFWQTFTDWELIVTDDGSTDGTRALLDQIQDPRIRLIVHAERGGLARRLNEAVGVSRGEFIARMDADDIAYPRRFAMQRKFLQQCPEIDLVGTAIMAFRDNYKPIGVIRPPERHAAICADPELGFSLAHPTWMGRAAFFKARPYNVLARRAQDQDLLLRSYSSAQFANLPQVLLGYRQEQVTAKNIALGRLQYCRSMIDTRVESARNIRLARGILRQLVRGAATIPAIAAGFGDYVVSRRYSKPTELETKDWADVEALLRKGA